MVTIRLHNSRTRTKEVFTPIDPSNVRVYVCGPTVYDRAHLGNARPVVVFDTLFRLLRHVYGVPHVTYVRNFTDVDDKINATALARKEAGAEGTLEQLIAERTEETIRWYHEDMDALGALRPAIRGVVSEEAEPRATAYVGQMIAMIGDLIARGHAYAKEGHVLFRVRSFADYGRLSGRSVDDMIAGARVEVAPFKEDPMDFVLWKPSDDSLPGWESPWGRGRPGWHIECSAMSLALLGASFDIHGGGIDLQFPHHENEVAQSCCAHPEADFARVWMHNEMLQVEGKKMSKSLGNFFTVRDLLRGAFFEKIGEIDGLVIRLAFLMSHYRDEMDFSRHRVFEVKSVLKDVREAFSSLPFEVFRRLDGGRPISEIVDIISDDLNTPLAIKRLHDITKQNADSALDVMFTKQIVASWRLLGWDVLADVSVWDRRVSRLAKVGSHDPDLMRSPRARPAILSISLGLNRMREEAKHNGDFTALDAAKNLLLQSGYSVQMDKAGVEVFRNRRNSRRPHSVLLMLMRSFNRYFSSPVDRNLFYDGSF